jgi:transcription-repair coupling factor (superfamily II helicase)
MATATFEISGNSAALEPNELVEVGEIVVSLLSALERGDLIYLAKDEARAAEIARAVTSGAPEAIVLFCPSSDALPGDAAPPSPANVGRRTAALRALRSAQQNQPRSAVALISTGEAAARLYPRPEQFNAAPPVVRLGDALSLEEFALRLEEIGYVRDDRVDEPGELALRGQVIDVFPADAGEPYRIEVHEDVVSAIRSYDPVTQRSVSECEVLELGRVREPELQEGVSLLEHLPAAAVALDRGADQRRRRFLTLASDVSRRNPKRAVQDVCSDERWSEALSSHTPLLVGSELGEPPERFVELRNPLRAFARTARGVLDSGGKLLLLGTARDLRFIGRRAAKALGLEPTPVGSWKEAREAGASSLLLLEMVVPRGFRFDQILAVSAADLLGSRADRGDDAPQADAHLFQLGEVRTGDVVVHEDHGIAVVAGLEAMPTGGDAIVLRFAGEARRLVPAAEASRIWRYGAEEAAVALDKLDGSTWEKRRGDVEAAVAETAQGLTKLAAERMKLTAPVIEPDLPAYERFSSEFPYTETADQARAIEAVRQDLASGKPMDRLVIGDVGYGKTEVALRAAAMVALAGRQVALAAPTTVLARQHLETFTNRFEGTGIKVAGLSRLSTAAEKKAVKAGLADGSIHVVVGTGAVSGKGVSYSDLSLVVIDEEQRFGAADKAKLRALSAGHVLALSATPIPRTLQQALIGLQQLSVIATPPARRQPIRTIVSTFDEQQVRTALLRERSRGGQSFVVVPRIEDMIPMAENLSRITPELELLQAHGKLPAADIDEAMVRFAGGDGDVLLATNIIEAGLDVPRANTMIVWRADRFGLSQLHQLRGRVGRGARRGQILLLTEPGANVAPRTLARLNTLQAFDRLGAGFAISARDLDLRGAGDVLGEEQAGHAKLIGVDLYQHLLERALRTARGEPADEWTPIINLGVEGRLPEEWVPDEDLRISLYARLSRITDIGGLEEFEDELEDRFGEVPEEAARVLAILRLRLLAHSSRVQKVDAGPAAIALTPREDFVADVTVAGLQEKNGRLLLLGSFEEAADRIERAEELLAELV